MDKALEQLVRQRANNACECCRLPQKFSRLNFPIDHVIAQQHQGETVEGNLALACPVCNRHKGPNIAGIDPTTKKLTRLFHPRLDPWTDHFRWNGAILVGLTDDARTTIVVLAMNDTLQVSLRSSLLEEGLFS